jgi:hypothetical protein
VPKCQLVREAHGCGGWTIVSAFLLWWTHRTFSVWHYWIDNWSASTILGSFIFHYLFFLLFFISAAQKKSLVFGVKILLSANLFAWLHISDNMIGLQKFHYGANFLLLVRLPVYALVPFNYLWNGCVHLTSYCTWGAREQRGLANVSAAWRKFTWIKSSEKQDSMKVIWPLV